MKTQFDPKAFGEKLNAAVEESGLSLRCAGEQIGISHSTLHRITKDGLKPSIESYLRIKYWLDARKAQ